MKLLGLFLLFDLVLASLEGDSLNAFKQAVSDPTGMLETWDPTLLNPCTWLYVTCNQDDLVTRVDLARGDLSGRLVPELANLKNLEHLELFNNSLTGSIPPEFGNLKSLVSLDLQYNHLSGSIPKSIGNMRSLVFLRLNDNQLSGQIPQELTTLPNLKVLDLSHNSFTGTVPRGGSFQKFGQKSFEGNPGLCGHAVKRPCT
ncbi:leucine-rich repeat protein 1 [Selaginella moellendorffii]|nr:leucine-rich repeat protein 1 [Selaginella moellendorffii]|eukprot:XP_002992346.2 leucine-rich repeat protein 1 [Selaginella moellendorffii]